MPSRSWTAPLAAFARAGIPLVISSGNHDSAVRLQYAGEVLAEAGIHLRTSIEQVTDPVLLADEAGQVGVYGIPFVLPDAVVAQLEVERSHAAVLGVLAERIRTDAAARGLDRVVVMAHAFVTGGSACESEREIRVGGVGDTPAEVFDGVSYVALGHLHGPQEVRLAGSPTVVEYSGSPLAFSFSERDHVKSVTVVDIDGAGRRDHPSGAGAGPAAAGPGQRPAGRPPRPRPGRPRRPGRRVGQGRPDRSGPAWPTRWSSCAPTGRTRWSSSSPRSAMTRPWASPG